MPDADATADVTAESEAEAEAATGEVGADAVAVTEGAGVGVLASSSTVPAADFDVSTTDVDKSALLINCTYSFEPGSTHNSNTSTKNNVGTMQT